MANTLFAGGPYFNVLARCATAITPTSTDANYPVTGLTDYKVSKPWRGGSAAATMTLAADLNQITNPGFAGVFSSSLPAAATDYVTWGNSGSATLTKDDTNHRTATGCLNVSGSDGVDYGYCDLKVFAGEKLHIGVWGKRLAGAGTAIVRVRNLTTRSYMTSAGAWQAASADALAVAGTVYTELSVDTTVESATTTQGQTMTLRFFFYASGSAGNAAVYDDFYVWSNQLTLSSVHGHNISQGVTVKLLADATASPTTVKGTFTPRLPSFYVVPTTITQRYVSLEMTTADLNPGGAIYIGEWVLCQALTLTRRFNYSAVVEYLDAQVRNTTESGATRAYLLAAEGGSRMLHWTFNWDALAAFQQARDQVFKVTRNGGHAGVFVPSDDDAEIVVFGRLSPSWSTTQPLTQYWQGGELVVQEEPMPTFVA